MCTEHYHWHHDYVRLAWDSGFSFTSHKTKFNLDISSISIIDIERVTRDRDVAVIEKHITSVLNYHLEEEQTRILDPTFVKIFKLSQLSIQYLQFCKRYLDNTVVLLKKELAKCKEENNHQKEYTNELKVELTDLKQKVKELRSLLQNQPNFNSEDGNGFRCSTCSKIFLTEEYLTAHVKRRHGTTNLLQSETDKLQLEIKELKERLNTTEKFIQNEQNIEPLPDNDVFVKKSDEKVENLVEKFEELKKFVERELTALRGEKNYEDKYDKWFEMLFERLDNSKKELQGEKGDNVEGGGDCLNGKADNGTQTVSVDCRDSGAMTEKVEQVVEDRSSKSPILEVDVQKIQENLISNTESHLGQMQDVLEQKLSGGLQQIQAQINTFWKKINELEEQKTSAIEKQTRERVPLPRQKTITSKQKIVESSTEVTESIEEDSIEKPVTIQPKPAPRITKKSPPTVKPIEQKPIEKKERSAVKTNLAKTIQTDSSTSEDEESSAVEVVKKRSSSQVKEIERRRISTVEVKKKPEVEVIYDKSRGVKIGARMSVSETDTEEQESPKVKTRPSTSTLGRRSISSLKQVMKDNDVLSGLQKELDEMISLRMKDIGVSPLWKGIPERSYFRALEVLQHQADLTAKKLPNYWKIRDKILRKVSNALKKSKNTKRRKDLGDTSRTSKISITKVPKTLKKIERKQQPVELAPVLDLSSDDSNLNRTYSKSKTQVKLEQVTKQSITDASKDGHQKHTPIATPVKKKVLFDLEDSSSTSKTKPVQKNIDAMIKELEAEDDQMLNFTIVKSKEKLKSDSDASQKIDLTASRSITTVFKIQDGESMTSSPENSVFEAMKAKASRENPAGKEDVSDWDISEILD